VRAPTSTLTLTPVRAPTSTLTLTPVRAPTSTLTLTPVRAPTPTPTLTPMRAPTSMPMLMPMRAPMPMPMPMPHPSPPLFRGSNRRCLPPQPVADAVRDSRGQDHAELGHAVGEVANAHPARFGGAGVPRGHADGLHAFRQFSGERSYPAWRIALGASEDDLLPSPPRVVVVDDNSGVEDRLDVPHTDTPGLECVDRRSEFLRERVRFAELLLHGQVVRLRRGSDLERDGSHGKLALSGRS
jgi:hypothetical protein